MRTIAALFILSGFSILGCHAAGEDHWAFRAPERPAIPQVEQMAWPKNPIDFFILAKLEKEGLKPSAEAERRTLIRRLSLDLTGLLPTPKEVEDFVNDTAPDAYEKLVDRLLGSPHYGERWGRHWLDAARYADSNGYSIDAPRSMWPYRDWVITALNSNMPFDQFVVEQLAGDLLPGATIDQRIATGFHRNTQINQEGGIDPEQFRIESIFDRIDTTSSVLLGLTVACAQCHDHKFDPITQKEYYQFFAFFNQDDEPTLEIAPEEEIAKRNTLQAEIKALEKDMKERAEELKKQLPRFPTTLVLKQRAEPRRTYKFIKGDFTRPAELVEPNVPAILHDLPAKTNLTRLDLARWIVAPENPLTARVTVNRIWQRYFGQGIVQTQNDFGTQGIQPTHPELLDWLATEFIASRWSLKDLHRLIVTSATYRQSSHVRPESLEADPANRLLARQARLRLDAEIVRDAALCASGLLTPTVGGPSVFPPQPEGVMTLGQSRRAWKADTGSDRYRRGMYTFFWRATPYPSLVLFDAPDSFSSCTRRIRSNTPLQALTLLNDDAFVEMARGLAERILDAPLASDPARITRAFEICMSRPPSDWEIKRLEKFLEEQRQSYGADPAAAKAFAKPPSDSKQAPVELAAWTDLARVLLNLDEMITRE